MAGSAPALERCNSLPDDPQGGGGYAAGSDGGYEDDPGYEDDGLPPPRMPLADPWGSGGKSKSGIAVAVRMRPLRYDLALGGGGWDHRQERGRGTRPGVGERDHG